MTKFQRVKEIFYGIAIILAALLMICSPSDGYIIIIAILSLWFTFRGLSTIIYYLTMSRFMVGGRESLFMGVIMMDFGILTGTFTSIPHYYVLLYLVAMHGFSGVVEILRAMEARNTGASWRLKMSHGIIDFAMAMICIIWLKQPNVTVIIYSVGLLYSAILRIISACRKTKLVYIQ